MGALKQAEIIPISKGKGNMTDKFEEGHVRSSWQYRRDVYPFLSDAARHVYFMLEGYINGFNKESDYVSYSQLQEEKRHKDNPKAEYLVNSSHFTNTFPLTNYFMYFMAGVVVVNHGKLQISY